MMMDDDVGPKVSYDGGNVRVGEPWMDNKIKVLFDDGDDVDGDDDDGCVIR